MRKSFAPAALIFLCAFAFLWWTSAARLSLDYSDEGIYFDGAMRLIHGQMPYRDFFALTGPGTFLLIASSLKVFGLTLAAARVPVIFDLAILTACVFWITSKLSGPLAAALTSIAFLAFETCGQSTVLANHRWDSAAWSMLATTLIFAAMDRENTFLIAAAGFASAVAAWCTPPAGLVAIALALCFRKRVAIFASGFALAVAPIVIWLSLTKSFGAMLDSLLWSASNYSGPNRTPYAWVNGGYAALFRGSSAAEIAAILGVLIFFTLPATLPFVSALWIFKHPKPRVVVLLASGFAMFVSTWPRWDLMHLLAIAAPFYCLTAALIAQTKLRTPVTLITMMIAISYLGVAIKQRTTEASIESRAGKIHGDPKELAQLQQIEQQVHTGDALFVFPYRPALYFLTGAVNPTRYSFLQPGMFPEQDERAAIDQLQAAPPAWVYYMNLPASTYLRIWPSSNPARLRLPDMEDFLKRNYHRVDQQGDLQLLRKN